jgi:hypothetical protein
MPKIEEIRDTMYRRLDPTVARSIAYFVTAIVVIVDKYLGGSWWAAGIALVLVTAACWAFPIERPGGSFRIGVLRLLRAIRRWSVGSRIAWVVFGIAAVSARDFYVGGLELGKGYNLYLLVIFLSSLLFGLPLAVLTWLLSFLAAYYCLLPPRYSFDISTLKDFADLMGYFYLGLLVIAVPVLIRASSTADA